jgi:hypothetical protein
LSKVRSEARILLLDLLHPLGLTDLKVAIFFAPAIVSLLRHAYCARCLRSCSSANEANLDLTQLCDNLFRLQSLAHISTPYLKPN